MKIVGTASAGLHEALFIDRSIFRDARGTFSEIWRDDEYRDVGIMHAFVQDNVSRSVRGALRGLHLQRAPHEQGKLLTVVEGNVWEAILDLRPTSPTHLQCVSFELTADAGRQLWIPPGFAHGFQCTSDYAIVHYKCTAYRSKEHEIAVNPMDPALGIRWPIHPPTLSDKDAAAPLLSELRLG